MNTAGFFFCLFVGSFVLYLLLLHTSGGYIQNLIRTSDSRDFFGYILATNRINWPSAGSFISPLEKWCSRRCRWLSLRKSGSVGSIHKKWKRTPKTRTFLFVRKRKNTGWTFRKMTVFPRMFSLCNNMGERRALLTFAVDGKLSGLLRYEPALGTQRSCRHGSTDTAELRIPAFKKSSAANNAIVGLAAINNAEIERVMVTSMDRQKLQPCDHHYWWWNHKSVTVLI